MITKLEVRDWKSFEEGQLYIDPLTIMIGTNASGKSNILDALHFLQRLASGIGINQAINGDVNLKALRGGMEWVCRKPQNEFTIALTVQGDSENLEYHYEVTINVNGVKGEVVSEKLLSRKFNKNNTSKETRLYYTQEVKNQTREIPVYFPSKTLDRGKIIDCDRSNIILTQADGMNLVKDVQLGIKAVLSQLKTIFVFDPIPSHMRGYTTFSEKLLSDGSNIAGVLAALAPDHKEDVEKTLTKYLKALPERDIKKVWTEPVGKFGTDAMLYCEEGWLEAKDNTVDARGMSDGTLRYLAIVTALLTRATGSLLVIEEVDNGLHPSRANILLKMLRELGGKRNIDVLVTTHNPAMLDAAGPQMVPFITVIHRNNSTGASHLTQLEDLNHLPKLLAGGSLGKISTEGKIEMALKGDSV